MDSEALSRLIARQLPYAPNEQQQAVVGALARFAAPLVPDGEGSEGGEGPASGLLSADHAFLLAGYAGTGKTSLTGALVRVMTALKVPVVLMAPTGRAAKVFAAYSSAPVYTIHRKIYRYPDPSSGLAGRLSASNNLIRALFVIDEASMIGAEADASGASLLDDLIQYVYSGTECRMLLMGDTAQLPPVGCEESPAMNPDVLRSYGLKLTRVVLTSIARQSRESGILKVATALRRGMQQTPLPVPDFRHVDEMGDVHLVSGEDLPELLEGSYGSVGIDGTVLITRSNKRAVLMNLAIRSDVLYHESEMLPGEPLLVTRNNYLWTARVKGLDFLANGDVVHIVKVIGTENRYGFNFADVELSCRSNNPQAPEVSFQAKILVDTLNSELPELSRSQMEALYQAVVLDSERYPADMGLDQRMRLARRDPYLNALQVKYAYAVTCHKAQGGQWDDVYVDLGGIAPDAFTTIDFYRWLYTAVTRARRNLYLVNAGRLTDD